MLACPVSRALQPAACASVVQIRHPHIVNLLEVMSSRDKIFMVMELVTGGGMTLHRHLAWVQSVA
jgi:serine/threonine protein kinase